MSPSNSRYLSNTAIFHFHDYGRKSKQLGCFFIAHVPFSSSHSWLRTCRSHRRPAKRRRRTSEKMSPRFPSKRPKWNSTNISQTLTLHKNKRSGILDRLYIDDWKTRGFLFGVSACFQEPFCCWFFRRAKSPHSKGGRTGQQASGRQAHSRLPSALAKTWTLLAENSHNDST